MADEVLSAQAFTRLHVNTRGGILPAMATLGGNIRRARERMGFGTQAAGARALGWSQSRLSDLENDRYESVDTATLIQVAKIFECSIEDLVLEIDAVYDAIRARVREKSDLPSNQRTAFESELLERWRLLKPDTRESLQRVIWELTDDVMKALNAKQTA
jgi:transcriptional regulator with XRE-family HTH domain